MKQSDIACSPCIVDELIVSDALSEVKVVFRNILLLSTVVLVVVTLLSNEAHSFISSFQNTNIIMNIYSIIMFRQTFQGISLCLEFSW